MIRMEKCSVCNGSGKLNTVNQTSIYDGHYLTIVEVDCPNCKGQGWIKIQDFNRFSESPDWIPFGK